MTKKNILIVIAIIYVVGLVIQIYIWNYYQGKLPFCWDGQICSDNSTLFSLLSDPLTHLFAIVWPLGVLNKLLRVSQRYL